VFPSMCRHYLSLALYKFYTQVCSLPRKPPP